MKLKKIWWQSLLLLGGLIIFDLFFKPQNATLGSKTKMTEPNSYFPLATQKTIELWKPNTN